MPCGADRFMAPSAQQVKRLSPLRPEQTGIIGRQTALPGKKTQPTLNCERQSPLSFSLSRDKTPVPMACVLAQRSSTTTDPEQNQSARLPQQAPNVRHTSLKLPQEPT